MKKITSLILVFACMVTCIVSFTSCDPAIHGLDVDELLANTVKIELVHYENENPELYKLKRKKKPTFDFNKVTLLATLDDSKIEDVVNYVGTCGYLYWGRTNNEPVGKTLILYQSNGDMLVLYACIYKDEKGKTSYPGACIMFDKDGKYIEYIGDFGYMGMNKILYRYFPEIEESNTSP